MASSLLRTNSFRILFIIVKYIEIKLEIFHSCRALFLYIFAFRNRFLSSLTKQASSFSSFTRCVWNSSCVCVRPPPEDLQKRFPPSLPQYLFFPRGSFQSFRIEEYVHLYHLYRGNPSFRLPLCVRDTAPIVRQFAATFSTNRCLHHYFPLTILLPSLLIIIL